TSRGISNHCHLSGRFDGCLRTASSVDPHDDVGVAERQGFTMSDTGQLIEVVSDPIRPERLIVIGRLKPGDPQTLRKRCNGQTRNIRCHPAKPVSERFTGLWSEVGEGLAASIVT